jgi:hypothetical protein
MSTDQKQLSMNGVDGASGTYLTPPLTPDDIKHIALNQGRMDTESEHYQDIAARWSNSPRNLRRGIEEDTLPGFPAASQKRQHGFLGVAEGVDARDLAQSGWGVIFPNNVDPAIKDALHELLQHRHKQAGEYYKEFPYFEGDTKLTFLSDYGCGPGPVNPANGVPYYLLIVGDPQQIPYRFQYQLDVQFAVGRIHFDTLEEYASYARSVVAAESGAWTLPRRSTFFGVRNDDDRATHLSADELVAPLARHIAAEYAGWEHRTLLADQTRKAQLAHLLGGPDTPAFLFAACHGMGFPASDRRQLAHQGALLCYDWPGPHAHRGPVPQDYYLAGDDLSSDGRLLGLIAFFFACYGAGTPHLDDFARRTPTSWEQKSLAPYPFVANLPRRMLAHPGGGALAVVSHVDRAWGYSFLWGEYTQKAQLEVFRSTIKRLFDGYPIGAAIEFFNERYAELSTELTLRAFDEVEVEYGKDSTEFASLWTANNDARNYTIIGDPAVRLPIHPPHTTSTAETQTQETVPTMRERPTIEPVTLTTVASPRTRTAPVSPPSTPSANKPAQRNLEARDTEARDTEARDTEARDTEARDNAQAPPPDTRVINAWIHRYQQNEPLTLGTTYELKCNVDRPYTGSGEHPHPDTTSERVTPDEELTEILVTLETTGFTIYGETEHSLFLSREGASKNTITFTVEPNTHGVGTITALGFVHGRICQQTTRTFPISNGSPTSHHTHPPRTRGRTFASMIHSHVSPHREYPTIQLAIIKAGSHLQFILHSSNSSNSSNSSITRARIMLNEPQIATLITRMQQDITHLTTLASNTSHTGIPTNTESLTTLATLGHTLYESIFYAPGNGPDAHAMGNLLRTMSQRHPLTIEISAEQCAFPWTLLYDRHPLNLEYIEPEGFWGLKHIIEYRTEFSDDGLTTFTPHINVDNQVQIRFLANHRLDQEAGQPVVQHQRDALQNLDGCTISEYTTRDDFSRLLDTPDLDDHILYCYCTASSPLAGMPGTAQGATIGLSDGDVQLEDLSANTPASTLPPSQTPLLFLNACESPNLNPSLYTTLVPLLLKRGIGALIGTIANIPATDATRFAQDFLQQWTPGTRPAGEVLRDIRREYVANHHNLVGLLYALYGSGELVIHRTHPTHPTHPKGHAEDSQTAARHITTRTTATTAQGTPSDGPVETRLEGERDTMPAPDHTSPHLEHVRETLLATIHQMKQQLDAALQDTIVETRVSSDIHRDMAQASLRAITRIKSSGNMHLSLPDTIGGIGENVRTMHLDLVEQARIHRLELISTLTSAITELAHVLAET